MLLVCLARLFSYCCRYIWLCQEISSYCNCNKSNGQNRRSQISIGRYSILYFKTAQCRIKPEYYLADAGDSSKNGFTHFYMKPLKQVVYWSNVISAIKQKLSRIKDANHRKRIREYIFRIRSSQNEFIFAKAVLLFESKWRGKYNNEEVDEFVDYFKLLLFYLKLYYINI